MADTPAGLRPNTGAIYRNGTSGFMHFRADTVSTNQYGAMILSPATGSFTPTLNLLYRDAITFFNARYGITDAAGTTSVGIYGTDPVGNVFKGGINVQLGTGGAPALAP